MDDEVKIDVVVRPSLAKKLTLILKVYLRNNEFYYIWRSSESSDYFLEIVTKEKNYIYVHNINKDPRILTSKEIIARQMMEKMPIMD
jgi:hypothetical protein